VAALKVPDGQGVHTRSSVSDPELVTKVPAGQTDQGVHVLPERKVPSLQVGRQVVPTHIGGFWAAGALGALDVLPQAVMAARPEIQIAEASFLIAFPLNQTVFRSLYEKIHACRICWSRRRNPLVPVGAAVHRWRSRET
jgi:hypothetical protein